MLEVRGWHVLTFKAPLLLALAVGAGCNMTNHAVHTMTYTEPAWGRKVPVAPLPIPRELSKTVLPDYIIEPPDILLINALRVTPLPPYRIHPLDVIGVRVLNTLPDRPLDGAYTVETGGRLELGPPYGSVNVASLSIDEATEVVTEHLRTLIADPVVSVTLLQTVGEQQIAGEHIVGPDGRVSLGTYGKVLVAGLTQSQARQAIEEKLAESLDDPEVSVEIFAYNSKNYYIITQGAGLGDGVVKIPVTGNETVLDAIAEIQGLESVSSKRIWVARPAPEHVGSHQILPVDWQGITEFGATATNYQLLPGDRVFVAEDPFVATDTFVSKVLSPFERVAGFISLGTSTVSGIKFFNARGSRGSGF